MNQQIFMLETVARVLSQVPVTIVFTGIVAVLDGRSNLFKEVQQANGEVKAFLSEWFRAELENLCEIAPAFLSPAARNSGRARLVLQTIERLAISVDY